MRRLSVFLLMLLLMMMLCFTRPRLVKARVLASTLKQHNKPNINIVHQPMEELNLIRGTSSSSVKEKEEEKDKPAENKSSRVLIGNEYHTMASGPSRKGSGH